MTDEVLLREAIEAVREQKFDRARDLLTRLLRNDQNNPTYWLWMSTAVQTPKERRYCLETVLRLDPTHEQAKQGLALLGISEAEIGTRPLSLPRRKWDVEERIALSPQEEKDGRKTFRRGRVGFGAILLTLLIFVGWGLALMIPRRAVPTVVFPTRTPGPPPTFTPTPTYIGFVAPLSSESLAQPTPLWMLLEATYTPTPLYVNTPHPVSEAFRAGLVAYHQGAWDRAIAFFEQAQEIEPQAADIAYYLGETFRLMGEPHRALEAYAQALRLNPSFAPALLGRARANLSLNPGSDVLPDLNQALQIDPNLAEAYLERAKVYLKLEEVEKALQDADKAEELLPSSPLPPLMRAQILLQQGNVQQAYQEAQKAYARDRTLLEAYRLLGETALLNGELEQAREVLQIYLEHEREDSAAYTLYARALIDLGEEKDLIDAMMVGLPSSEGRKEALQALDRALALEPDNAWARIARSCLFLELEEGQKAVNDLTEARSLLFQRANAQKDPLWFAYHLALSRALLEAGRLEAAEKQFNYAAEFAKSNREKAALYYWRGRVYLALEQKSLAQRDWAALLKLPPQEVPLEWRRAAQSFLVTPTHTSLPWRASPTPQRTPSPTLARTATP
ncbi:MAG: tetratricopeptide repeat protein [Anaerolineales bacterium]|nr:tetratricopeptide repeat protein [Anaerolineales bacterium]MDW8447380.1 tetratricopeptide repeat protein [Anaerolineales bacterium]